MADISRQNDSLYVYTPNRILLLAGSRVARDYLHPQDWAKLTEEDRKAAVDLAEAVVRDCENDINELQDNVWYTINDELQARGYATRELSLTPVVYVAGPVTGIADDNRPAFEHAREQLLTIDELEVVTVPHDFVPSNYNHEDAMRVCLDYLVHEADIVALLPGWENSRGASLERDVAEQLGIPTMTIDQVESYVNTIYYPNA